MTTTINNRQPSLAFTRTVVTVGDLPFPGNGPTGANLVGSIFDFAGSFAPAGTLLADGTLVANSSEDVLSAALGTTYGGASGSFNLPT